MRLRGKVSIEKSLIWCVIVGVLFSAIPAMNEKESNINKWWDWIIGWENILLITNQSKSDILKNVKIKNTVLDLDAHVKKILAEVWIPDDVIEKLSNLPKKHLDSILMQVFLNKSRKVDRDSILKQFENNICQPIDIDIRKLHEIEYKMNLQLPQKYELLNLSHLNPFGLNAFLTKNSQKKMITTSKGYDLNSDWWTSLALEWMKRRNELKKSIDKKNDLVYLATHFHCMRTQFFWKTKPPHFKVFCNAICWKDTWDGSFDVNAVSETVEYYLGVIDTLKREGLITIDKITINISDMDILYKLFAQSLNNDKGWVIENISSFRLEQIENGMSVFDHLKIDEIMLYKNISEIDNSFIEKFGLKNNIIYLEKIYNELKKTELRWKNLWLEINIDLWRTKWLWCYNRLAVEMLVPRKDWKVLDIMDGGIAERNAILMWDKKERVFVSGFWTDRLVEHYGPKKR